MPTDAAPTDLPTLSDATLQELSQHVQQVRAAVAAAVVGQQAVIDRLILALLCDGHVLLEGVPGVAKTLMAQSLAQAVQAQFSRVQFTPDLLPSDLTGTVIYDPRDHSFNPEKGPLFANFVLADEINRAPAKVQSALLEAMQEQQVTLGKETFALPQPFLVLATQNPIEQEGTYPLPEAQVDRFLFKLVVDYPNVDEELEVMRRRSRPRGAQAGPIEQTSPGGVPAVLGLDSIATLRSAVGRVSIAAELERYIVRLVDATRRPQQYQLDFGEYLRYGASPRATIALAVAARGMALMACRNYVVPEDIKAVAHDVLRHRLALSYRAEAERVRTDVLIDRMLAQIPIADPAVPASGV